MIRYALACNEGHEFESWFRNSDAFEEQSARKLVACPVCNSAKVEKMLMAPRLTRTERQRGKAAAPGAVPEEAPAAPSPEAAPATPQEAPSPVAMMSEQERELRGKLKELREHLTRNASYVGQKFPEEARRMHYGETEHRSIYGEASLEDAKALHEEGIEFHPIPLLPDDRN